MSAEDLECINGRQSEKHTCQDQGVFLSPDRDTDRQLGAV